jgi:hypothetical protein
MVLRGKGYFEGVEGEYMIWFVVGLMIGLVIGLFMSRIKEDES